MNNQVVLLQKLSFYNIKDKKLGKIVSEDRSMRLAVVLVRT